MTENTIIKEGYLVKSPPQEKLMASWHKRFFVLWSTGYMEYYSSGEKRPQDYLKTLDLNGCEDMVAPFPVGGRTFVIKIAIANKGKVRDYFFDCDNQDMMEEWVSLLAEVCGFTAVDCEVEADNYSEVTLSPLDVSPSAVPQPSRSLPTEPRNPMSPSPNINRPKLRPPLPPFKPSSPPPDFSETTYEDPNFVEYPSEYSQVSSEFVEEIEEDLYDSNISETLLVKLNQRPPPVWKNPANSVPPPLPNRQKTFRRSLERGTTGVLSSTQFDFPNSPPPPLPGRNFSPNVRKPLPTPPSKNKKPKPPPPPAKKSRASTPPGRSTGIDFRADLGSKLNQRKLTKSWSEDEQLPYEEVEFLGEEPKSPGEYSEDSDTGSYVECDPSEPQAYLDYQFKNNFLDERAPSLPPRQEELPLPLPPREPKMFTVPPREPKMFTEPPPPLPYRTNPVDEDEEAPPIPRRHPHASGRGRDTLPLPPTPESPRSNSPSNTLPIPPRTKSPLLSPHYEEDEAPPVPVRGAESSRPHLNRPLSDNRSSRGQKPLPPSPKRGISVPGGAARLPIPFPKINKNQNETEDNVFEDVSFNQNNTRNQSLPPPPVSKTNKFQIITEDTPSTLPPKSSRPPIQIPKNTRESSSKPAPPSVRSKPNFSVPPPAVTPKPKATSPPPKPFAQLKPTTTKLAKNSPANQSTAPDFRRKPLQRENDFRNSTPTSPTNLVEKNKLPEPSFQEIMEKRKKLADTKIDRDVDTRKKEPPPAPEVRSKLPQPPIHNGMDSRKKLPNPPSNRTETRNKLDTSFLNGPGSRSGTPPVSKSPGARKKLPEPPSVSPKKETFNNREIAKRPPPISKAKPVMKQLQNSELATCLQNNSTGPKRSGGGPGSPGHKPRAPLKPKPALLPPRT